MTYSRFVIAGAIIGAVALAGCSIQGSTSVECTGDPLLVVNPSSAILATGDTLTLQALLQTPSCDLIYVTADSMRWKSANPAVVAVDSLTGVVTAKANGTTMVTGTKLGTAITGSTTLQVLGGQTP
ncbi:MAG TPA: Ig-like domain-containing protein [Gemmatimonadaceae bacterium]|jgi:hypothetical protein|nr:Ig-like domain-containing protein [Gemmatimonadaceae bacterium]